MWSGALHKNRTLDHLATVPPVKEMAEKQCVCCCLYGKLTQESMDVT